MEFGKATTSTTLHMQWAEWAIYIAGWSHWLHAQIDSATGGVIRGGACAIEPTLIFWSCFLNNLLHSVKI